MKECSKCRNCYEDNLQVCPKDNTPLMVSVTINLIINDRYLLEKRLGKGGMGIVFKAKHKFLKSAHAIKIILPNLVDNDESLLIRFNQEAVLSASIDHPNVIRVTDFGVEDGVMPYLVMEYIDGEDLSTYLIPDQPMTVEKALEYFKPIAEGVAEAHKQGIVHRDLKPQNIMIQKGLPLEKAIKVLDFGLAKIKTTDTFGSLVQANTLSVIGSPAYMSPEQWENDGVDHKTDIYALGVLLYQMLSGKLPFDGNSVPAVMYQHLTAEPPSFDSINISISPFFEAIVVKALQKDPANRYQHVEELLTDFENAVRQDDLKFKTSAETEFMPHTRVTSEKPRNTKSESLSRTQKNRLSEYFDSSEQDKALADTQLAQEFLQAKDRIEEAEEKASEADKLVQEFAVAEQYAQDAQQKAIEAKKKIEEDVRRRVEAEMSDKHALEKQAQQQAEAERLAKEAQARAKAEEEANRLAQVALQAQKQAEEARQKAEIEFQQRAYQEDGRKQAELEANRLAEQVSIAKRKFEEAQQKAAQEAQLRLAADEKRQNIENELQAIAEHEAERRRLAEAEVQRLIQEQASLYEEEAKNAQKTIDDAKNLAELEAQKRAEAEAEKTRAEEEAKKLSEEIRQVKAQMEEIKQHSSQTPDPNTISHTDAQSSSFESEETISSDSFITEVKNIPQPQGDVTIPMPQQINTPPVNQEVINSSQNISQHTSELNQPQVSDENISGLLNTNPIEQRKFPIFKVLIGVFSLFFVMIVGSVALYFIAFSGTSTPKTNGNQVNKQPNDNQPISVKSSKIERVSIDGGSFKMGRSDVPDQDPLWGLQYPSHPINVEAFEIDKTETTNEEYAVFVNETNYSIPSNWGDSKPRKGTEKLPVTFVSLEDANSYAKWVSKKENKNCRLPTEEEWEFAARNGSDETTYPWGNEWQTGYANVGTQKISNVGSTKDETSKGVKDMLGNVLEWTSSEHKLYPGHPKKLQEITEKLFVVRGSSWGELKSKIEKSKWLLTNRQFVQPEQRNSYLGFRLACKPK